MNDNKIGSYEDEPPNKIQNVKSNNNNNRGWLSGKFQQKYWMILDGII